MRRCELGITLIDTADSYGPYVSEDLIREVLHPYTGLTIATKGGRDPSRAGHLASSRSSEYLRPCVLMSLRHLAVDRIDLWQLHRIDPAVPRDEQFDVIGQMEKEGLIRHVGFSEVSVKEIVAAGSDFIVTTMLNRYNLVDRKSEAVIEHCETKGIGFIPWSPLAAGSLVPPRVRAHRDRRPVGRLAEPGGVGLGAEAFRGSPPADPRHR